MRSRKGSMVGFSLNGNYNHHNSLNSLSSVLTPVYSSVQQVIRANTLRLDRCQLYNFDFVEHSRLEKLVLYDPQLEDTARASLEDMLSTCNKLVSLEISHCVGPSEDVKWLAGALQHLPQLTRLNLYANYLGPKRMKQISASLFNMTHVAILDLSSNALKVDGMRYLAASLGHMTQVTDLNLSYNNLGVDGAKHLAGPLKALSQMRKMKLACNWMGPEGVLHLLPMFTQMRHLTSLNLRDNNPGDAKKEVATQLSTLRFLAL